MEKAGSGRTAGAALGGHGCSYATGRIVKGLGRLAVSTAAPGSTTAGTSAPGLRITSYDRDSGTLYLQAPTETNETDETDVPDAEAELTDDEMIVIRDRAGRVVSVTVPFVDTYWSRRPRLLREIMADLGGVDPTELAMALGGGATIRGLAVEGAYRHATVLRAMPYRPVVGGGLRRT